MAITWGPITRGYPSQYPPVFGNAEYAPAFDGPYATAFAGYLDFARLSPLGVWGPFDAGEGERTYYLRQSVPWGGKARLSGSNSCVVSRPVGLAAGVNYWLLQVENKTVDDGGSIHATATIDAAWFAGTSLAPHIAVPDSFEVPIGLIDGSDGGVMKLHEYELIVQATYSAGGNLPYPNGRGVGWAFTVGFQTGTLACGQARGGFHLG